LDLCEEYLILRNSPFVWFIAQWKSPEAMAKLEVPLVDESGKTFGFGDRWWIHRVRKGPDGPILGRRHVGITIACFDETGRILVAHRRHKIFDKVWTLSGDTHPYRVHGKSKVESLDQAAKRCAMDDLGVVIRGWADSFVYTYSARDPRDPRYCENELLHVMAASYKGPFHMNARNAYELGWAELVEISKESAEDLERKPVDRKYAPWVHAFVAQPEVKAGRALLSRVRA
jgi:isopentenyldiphosphate isomerase